MPVIEIGANAFNECSVEKVIICENVEKLGMGAFLRCGYLESVELPESLVSIGEHAFYLCVSLSEITVPDNVTEICGQAFSGCFSLENVNIGAGVEYIGEWAFEKCDKLETANFAVTSGWSTVSNLNYGELISVSPNEAARALKEYCGYIFIRK